MDWQATDAVLLFQPDCALRPHLLHGPSWIHSPPWCWRKTHTRSSALSFLFQSNSSWLFRTWEEPSLDFQRPFQFVLLSHTFWITWSHPHGCYHHHHPSKFSQMESHSPLRLHLTVFPPKDQNLSHVSVRQLLHFHKHTLVRLSNFQKLNKIFHILFVKFYISGVTVMLSMTVFMSMVIYIFTNS